MCACHGLQGPRRSSAARSSARCARCLAFSAQLRLSALRSHLLTLTGMHPHHSIMCDADGGCQPAHGQAAAAARTSSCCRRCCCTATPSLATLASCARSSCCCYSACEAAGVLAAPAAGK